jgi:hypothetical protein
MGVDEKAIRRAGIEQDAKRTIPVAMTRTGAIEPPSVGANVTAKVSV